MLFRRDALQKWKQKLGAKATCSNLIEVFKQAGYENYAEFVEGLVKKVRTDTGNFSKNAIDQTPSPPLEQPLLVFPSEFSESPSYAAAAGAKLLQEDYQLGTAYFQI